MQTYPRDQRFLVIDILLAIALLATILLRAQATAGAAEIAAPSFADVAGQTGDSQLTTGDLGVADAFVTSTTEVNTPHGKLAGIDGVQQYIESLEARYPDASFQVTDVNAVNSMLIVDWRGTVGGEVVLPGRTLITIENGAITDIWFLNLNSVSPSQGATSSVPATSPHAAVEPAGDVIVSGTAPKSFATDADQDAR